MDETGGGAQLFQQIGALEIDRARLMPSVRPASLAGFSARMNEIAGCGPDVGQLCG
jgi:hypothetical protein